MRGNSGATRLPLPFCCARSEKRTDFVEPEIPEASSAKARNKLVKRTMFLEDDAAFFIS